MIKYILAHKFQLIVAWLAVQNILKAIQDAFDTLPKDKPIPIITKIILVMQSISGYLALGNRPTTGIQK